jgi:hypothetical protein
MGAAIILAAERGARQRAAQTRLLRRVFPRRAKPLRERAKISVGLTFVTDMFTISRHGSGLAGGPPNDRDALMRATRGARDGRMVAAGRHRSVRAAAAGGKGA